MRDISLPDGARLPVLGQGTWMMAGRGGDRAEEIRALRRGIDLGMRLLDTAEMYGNGASEELVGEAVAERRDEVFLVSKVLPSNASRQGVKRACEASLRRLRVEALDLYLLHWRGGAPLSETLAGFEDLLAEGKIRRWGVSNFDLGDMEELLALSGGASIAANQMLYNPQARGAEFGLMPWLERRRVPVMAYSPLGQGGALLRSEALARIARRHGASPAQIALAWAIRSDNVMAIPKAGRLAHVEANAAAAEIRLDEEDLAEIDRAFPPPKRKAPLEMI